MNILNDIEAKGDEGALHYAAQFDHYDGNLILTEDEIAAAAQQVPQKLKDDIAFAHDNVRRFAQLQRSTIADVDMEIVPGLTAGRRFCQFSWLLHIPGGRYSHIASAIMTVTTAKVAGVNNVIACSPPRPGIGIAPAIIYAANLCGADKIWRWAVFRA